LKRFESSGLALVSTALKDGVNEKLPINTMIDDIGGGGDDIPRATTSDFLNLSPP
jgi:hypothetical protein